MSRRAWPILLLVPLGLVPRSTSAHIEIVSHTTRFGPEMQKQAPCGVAGASEPGEVYVYAPGATVHIAWHEFIDHPGHYRIAFDNQGDDDFPTPTSADDRYANATVLIDGIADEDGVHDYGVDVTLPDIECERCTIQVIQVMTDKPPFGDGNDVYFHCIDVALSVGGDPSTGDGSSSDDDDESGCSCASDPGGLGLVVVGVLALPFLRRRRGSVDRQQSFGFAIESRRPPQQPQPADHQR
jgi:MYXO-CTERM domain-containing protein